ncbi:hypothetical protein [Fundicoccus culcitae]|uniref:Uncharacterized protein n=1 Tax=Fundicoccus culcitae TaxID=2969821 RepID=A0ABY5P7E7_9LACT|nr:hypothetical protein [Fundicoccus culcitae]UUX34659.1 hypothetical protein NRE15_03125 [Fundicoccus culcitae]
MRKNLSDNKPVRHFPLTLNKKKSIPQEVTYSSWDAFLCVNVSAFWQASRFIRDA